METLNPSLFPESAKEEAAINARIERLESLANEQAEVLEMISRGASLSEILEAITNWIQGYTSQDMYASILLADEEGRHLLHGAAPRLPESYNMAIHGVAIGPEVGSCGTAAYRKEMVIVEDIATNPLWENYRDLAIANGLRACWSVPLISAEGKLLGTFAIYYPEPSKPSPDDLRQIQLFSRCVRIAIEFKRSEEKKSKLLQADNLRNEIIKQERKHFYQLIMNAPAVIAILTGPNHVFELANTMYLQSVGNTRNLLGLPIAEALPELKDQGIFSLLDAVYKTGEPYQGNEVMVKLDRVGTGDLEDRYFNFVYHPLKNEEGSVDGIFVHAADITELVMARKRAEESEEKFRSFVLSSPSPIGIYIGREMRIQIANDAIVKDAWGKDASVIGKTFREALPELEGQPFYQLLDDVFTTGIPYQATGGRVDLVRNGKLEITYWNFTYKALRDAEGVIYGVINTGNEVTDLVLAKQQLALAEESLRNAVDIAELGTWSMETSTQRVNCSPRVMEWWGFDSPDVKLEDVLASIDEADRQTVKFKIENAFQSKEEYEAVYGVTCSKTGQKRILHAKGKLIFTETMGGRYYLNGTVRDVTLQKMTEQQLEQQVKLRTTELDRAIADLNNVNQNLKQFAYVASHDLQEPLRKINMFTDILLRKNQSGLDQQGQVILNKISQSARRMTNLIKDLLDFSKVDSKDLSMEETDLNHILNNIIVDFEVMIQQKSASLYIDQLCMVQAIPLQMNQLFYNLVGNALKFTREHVPPEIHITSRMMEVHELFKYPSLNKQSKYCEIVVRDNGIGFDQHFAEQIFTIFQRLHGRSEYEGTGIGLALCKKIVENHGGEIFANAKDGEGASFHVILPVSRVIALPGRVSRADS